MSRAFVHESDADPGALPERPVSPHPEFVTPQGLLSWMALAQSLPGRETGEAVPFQGDEAEIVAIDP